MEGQLIAGQWVEVSIEDLQSPSYLKAFVLSLKPTELLLTFPDLGEPPVGLESEARVTLRYIMSTGRYTLTSQVVRVAAGPPVTVTFRRFAPAWSTPRRTPVRFIVKLPVTMCAVSSSLPASRGPGEAPGWTQNLNQDGILLSTCLLLAVGDIVRLTVSNDDAVAVVHGRVIRVFENDDKSLGDFGMGIELVHEKQDEYVLWLQFIARLKESGRI